MDGMTRTPWAARFRRSTLASVVIDYLLLGLLLVATAAAVMPSFVAASFGTAVTRASENQ
jgi:hypothetical protein